MASAVIDQLEFDPVNGEQPSIVEVGPGVFAIAYSGPGFHGWLITVNIDAAGNIGSVIDSYEFDAASGEVPQIIHISGNIYAIVYERNASGGWVITVEIDAVGNITDPLIDSLRFFPYVIGIFVLFPSIIHVSGDIYAIVCTDINDEHGQLYTVEIDAAGNIGAAVVDSSEFDAIESFQARIVKVSGTTYAIAYVGPDDDGWIKTLTIADDGTIGADIDTLEFDNILCLMPYIIHVSGDTYAIAYQAIGGVGTLKTVDISALGAIGAVIDTLVFDAVYGDSAFIIELSAGIFDIVYRRSVWQGVIVTLPIAADGTIGAITETFAPGGYLGFAPSVVKLSATTIAIAYTGSGNDGWLRTIGPVVIPAVTNDPATAILTAAATLNGTLDNDGGEACDCGFEWGLTPVYGHVTPIESKTTGETFSQPIGGLSSGTTYHFRAFATNSAGTGHGADRTFTTALVFHPFFKEVLGY